MAWEAFAIDEAVAEARDENYLRAFTLFIDIYGSEDAPPIRTTKDASGLSYFALCLALVQKKYRPAIALCRRALELEFYNSDHYVNLTKVYIAAGNRRKALETADAGLRVAPDDADLIDVRRQLGVRARPSLPILDRKNPINVSLGRARHAKKSRG